MPTASPPDAHSSPSRGSEGASTLAEASARIAAEHPARPVAEWLQYLFACNSSVGVLSLTATLTGSAIIDRLTELLDVANVPDIATIAKLVEPEALFNPARLLESIIRDLDLGAIDAAFPWGDLHDVRLPGGIDQFDLPWQTREQGRLLCGLYQPVPWADKLPAIAGHYVHLSTENSCLVAYTQDADRGAKDIQTSIKPGRYLTRFYPDLASHVIRDLQSGVHRSANLQFAVTPDEIERVYLDGPCSCMSRPASSYDSHCHPVRVYGDSDLRLAYVTNDGGEPTARALVWPPEMRHGRIYGDQVLLGHLLSQAGYTHGDLTGARIRRLNNPHAVIMPYLDDDHSFGVVDEDWLVIGGPYDADSTSGLAYLCEMTTCEHCDNRVPSSDTEEVDGDYWCSDCCDSDSFVSDLSERRFRDSEQQEVVVRRRPDGTTEVQSWALCEGDAHAEYCDGSAAYYATNKFEFVRLANGQQWVDWYFAEHGDASLLPHDTPPASKGRQAAAEGRVAA